MEKQTTGQKQEVGTHYEKAPKFKTNTSSKMKQHFNQGITVFLVIAASILCYFIFLRFTNLFAGLGTIAKILRPILYGLVIAYLLRPIVDHIEGRFLPFLEEKKIKKQTAQKLSRGVGIAIALLVAAAIIVTLCNLVIPELYNSIKNMIYTVPEQLNQMIDKVNAMTKGNSTIAVLSTSILSEAADAFQTWLKNDLLRQTNVIMSSLTFGVINIISEILNVIIGFIVSVYVLGSKELFSGQCKKIVYALFTPQNANMVLHIARKSDKIFGGFIIGKIIDSLIIGILCFLCLSIMKMPYTLLVSVIVGVTNVIPFFGPYIGAIPSAILIILDNPIKGVYFIIFIIVLQQIDGNIIGPKILGDSTGLSAFWVVFSILLGGGLFGFVGMIMGVPTFAVIYYIVGMIINHKLEKKKLPTCSSDYDRMSYVDENTGMFIYSENYYEQKREEREGD